jgi:hypothetical protein
METLPLVIERVQRAAISNGSALPSVGGDAVIQCDDARQYQFAWRWDRLGMQARDVSHDVVIAAAELALSSSQTVRSIYSAVQDRTLGIASLQIAHRADCVIPRS